MPPGTTLLHPTDDRPTGAVEIEMIVHQDVHPAIIVSIFLLKDSFYSYYILYPV